MNALLTEQQQHEKRVEQRQYAAEMDGAGKLPMVVVHEGLEPLLEGLFRAFDEGQRALWRAYVVSLWYCLMVITCVWDIAADEDDVLSA